MKTIKYLTMAFAALFLSVTFTACGDDDDDDKPKSEQTENNGNNSENKGDKNDNAGNNSGNQGNENSGNKNNGNFENDINRDYSKDTKEAVDLGLSVKWATCNVGASSPEEYGSYFAWGETASKEVYIWDIYKYGNGYDNELIKYCTNSDYGKNGFVDNKTVLEASDDAATVNWGGAWRMPTRAEHDELRTKCTWIWTKQNGVKGYKVTSKTNDNSIFLPAAGFRDGTELEDAGSYGEYWSSSLDTDIPLYAYVVYSGWDLSDRYYGLTVRPVCK